MDGREDEGMKKCKMFDGEQENALMTALEHASQGDIYTFMEKPKSSFVCLLVEALNECGYKITKALMEERKKHL